MNLPDLETQIARQVHNMDIDQQTNIMHYVISMTNESAVKKEKYRKNALREIRKALKSI